jgi:putative ABC transport system permease protein
MAPTLRAWPGQEESARLPGWSISVDVMEMLGARSLIGRVFSAEDEEPGAEPVLLLSYAAWQRFFGGDATAIGRRVTLDAVLPPRVQYHFSIVGVMPKDFVFPSSDSQFWIPFREFGSRGASQRGRVIAQIRQGVPIEAASSDINAILHDLRPKTPGTTYEFARERDEMTADVRPALLVLTLAVGLVLLIACVNVSNLLLARASVRQREVAVRVAIGASRARLIRQMLTECGLLTALGTLLGVSFALGGVRLLRAVARPLSRIDLANGLVFPRLDEIGVDIPVLIFAVVTSIVVVLLCGIVPALRYSKCNPVEAFRGAADRSQTAGESVRGFSFRNILVISEVAFAIVLLVATGVLVRSFVKLSSVETGYDAMHVLTFQVSLPINRYSDVQLKSFADALTERLRAISGVRAAAYANQLPMVNLRNTAGDLYRTPDPTRSPSPMDPDVRLVSRDYFNAMGIRVLAGRGFAEHDREGAPRVLVINQALSNRHFAGDNPVGQSVFVGRDVVPWQIVGVVDNVRQFALDQDPAPQVFADIRQWSSPTVPLFPAGAYYAIRTDGDPSALVTSLRQFVTQLEPNAALFSIATMDDIVSATVARPRMYAVLLLTFSAVGLVLAVMGVYSVMAYSIAQRTREIGIRMSLGADRAQVVKMVLSQSLVMTGIGVGLGIMGAIAASGLLEGMVFGVTSTDQPTFIGVAIGFMIISTIAAFIPARRAARVDPFTALRFE